jgi:hypothetical protein
MTKWEDRTRGSSLGFKQEGSCEKKGAQKRALRAQKGV